MTPTTSRNVLPRTLLIAVLINSLVAGPAFAQQDFSGIPGLGASIPPKVFIIFDTSNSMRDLPQTQQSPSYIMAPDPVLPDGGPRSSSEYFLDDWILPDGGDNSATCHNRFCVGKRVLYNLLPTYSDSVQLGLAGYYQYRTRYLGTGSMRCIYDVLQRPGVVTNFTSSTTGLTSGVPTEFTAANCVSTPALTALHTYPYTENAPTPGAPINCAYNRDLGATVATGTSIATPGSGLVGDMTVCTAADTSGRTLTRGVSENIFRGGTLGNSNIWVRMARGTTTCPATIDFVGSAGGNDNTYPARSATAGDPSNARNTAVVQTPAWNATSIRATDISAGVGAPMSCTATNPCRLERDALAPTATDDAGTTLQVYGGGAFGVTAPAMTLTGMRTYTRQSGPTNNDFLYNPFGGGVCTRPDGGTAAVGDEYFVPSGPLNAVFGTATALNCSSPETGLEQGCRVVAQGFGSTATAGTIVGAPPATLYQIPGTALTSTCNTCTGSSTLTYTYTPGTNDNYVFNRGSGASCSALNQTNYQGASFGGSYATPVISGCSASTPCTLLNGAAATDSTRTAYNDTLAGPLETRTGPTSGGTVDISLGSYQASCPAVTPNPTTSGTYGCSASNPCKDIATVTSSPMDGGTRPADVFRLQGSLTVPGYTVVPGPTPLQYSTGAACDVPAGGSKTLTSGSVGGVTCTPAESCPLTNATPMCGAVPCTSDTYWAQNNCRYDYNRYTYRAPYYGVCRYQRQQWSFTQQRCTLQRAVYNRDNPACTAMCPTCNYRVQAWTYYYEDPYPYCRYYAKRYPYTGTTAPVYNYSWQTKGGEYLGSLEYNPATALPNYCSQSGSQYSAYAATCPTEISATVNSAHPFVSNCNGGKKCLLRWRNNANSAFQAGRLSYTAPANQFSTTYQTYGTTPRCLVPDRDGGETVMPDPSTYGLNNNATINYNTFISSGVRDAGPADFCRPVGGVISEEIRVRADWYQPAIANSDGFPSMAPSGSTTANTQSTRGPFKTYGLSVVDGGAAQTFVPIASNNLAAVRQALSRCVLPEADAGLTTPLKGGLCMAETGLGVGARLCGGSTCQNTAITGNRYDFTPLVGSLVNAKQYLQTELANDPDYLCREYYVLLVSDGLEDTPANYTQTNIRDAVGELRNPNPTGGAGFTAGARTKDVKTFVIGFGAGLGASDGGPTDLDIIARTGGSALAITDAGVAFDDTNGTALNAASQGQLESALALIFNNITGGAYSRSRPTLTSDGTRLYHAFFERGAPDGGGSPEWKGNVLAYDLPVGGGSLTQAWDHRAILDAMNPASRNLVAFMPFDGGMSAQNFVPGNSVLTNYIDSIGTYPNEGAASVAFARNDSLSENFTPIAIPRRTRVGAMVFSSPVAVGKSPFAASYGGEIGENARTSFDDSSPDGGYRGRVLNRPTRILIGGNDGLWRGISDRNDGGVGDGSEAWGIVPGRESLSLLPTARRRALPIVDGTTAVSEVCWPSSGTNAANCAWNDWRAVAIIALRQGGEAYTAVELKNDGSRPTFLWKFDDSQDYNFSGDDFGLTYAPPIFGRVEANNEKRWVAFFGGGQAQNSSSGEGDSIYVVDAKTGRPYVGGGSNDYVKFDNVIASGCNGRMCPSMAGRPAIWRRENKTDTDSVYLGSTAGCDGATSPGASCTLDRTGKLYAMRTRPTNDPRSDWRPREWFDPYDNHDSTRVDGQKAPIWKINKTTGAQTWPNSCRMPLGSGGGACSAYAVNPSFYNRPRLAAISDSSSINARPDLFIGTGDANNLNNATEQNFFFAIHDRGFLTPSASHDSEMLWAYAFDPGEKVTGEPAVVSGAVVVPTFVPPAGGTCAQFGDSYLYAFDPITGSPRNVLQDPANPSQFRSVVRLQDVGALSDLVVVNGRIYYATTRGGVGSNAPIQTGQGGRVQGWRRVR